MELRKRSGFLFLIFALMLTSAVDAHASFFNWGSCPRWRITGICRIVCHNFGCNVWVRATLATRSRYRRQSIFPATRFGPRAFRELSVRSLAVPIRR